MKVFLERDGRLLASSLVDAIRKKLVAKGNMVAFGVGCTGIFQPRADNSIPDRWIIVQINEEAMFAGGDNLGNDLGNSEDFPIYFAEDNTRQRLLELTVKSMVYRRR